MHQEFISLLATPISAVANLLDEAELNELRQACDELFNEQAGDKHGFNCDVWSSYKAHNIKEDERFATINSGVAAFTQLMQNEFCKEQEIRMFDGWVNRYGPHQHQEVHNHGNFMWSAVYYVDMPEGSAPLCMLNKNFPDRDIESDSDVWARTQKLMPAENTLIIFPSNVYHYVPVGTNATHRTSIAYNFELGEPFEKVVK